MILLALGILLVYCAARFNGSDTLVLRLWCAVWGISAFACAPIDTRGYADISTAFLYLLVLTATLAAGAGVGMLHRPRWQRTFPATASDPWVYVCSKRRHLLTLVGLVCLGFLSVQLLLNDLGKGLDSLKSLEEITLVAAAASIERYQNDFEPQPLTRVLATFMFLSASFAGWYWRRDASRWRILLAIAAFVPALLWTILLTTKATVLFWLIFYFATYLAFGDGDQTNRTRSAANSRNIRTRLVWIVGFAALVAFMFLVQLSRYGGDLETQGEDVVKALTVASVGHVYAFRDWFERDASLIPLTFGSRTFAGVFELLGLGIREIGIYGDNNVYFADSSTNVYSALRGVTEDLGIPLAVVATFLAGFVSGRIRAGSPNAAKNRAWLSVLLAWTIWSPIASIFSYNSLVLTCILLVLFSLQKASPTHATKNPQRSTRVRQLPLR